MTPPAAPQSAPRSPAHVLVTDDDTAAALGSGSLPVLGTPAAGVVRGRDVRGARGIAARGSTSVGTRVALDHLAAEASASRSR